MSDRAALQELAELVSRLCSEHRKLRKRAAELERKLQRLSGKKGKRKATAAAAEGVEGHAGAASSQIDKELLKAKVEEMLAELADIG